MCILSTCNLHFLCVEDKRRHRLSSFLCGKRRQKVWRSFGRKFSGGGRFVQQLRRVINSCLQSVWNEDWAAKRFQSKPPLIPSQCKETPKGVSMHKVKGLKLILSLAERVQPTFYVWSWAARFHVSFSSDGVCSVLLLFFSFWFFSFTDPRETQLLDSLFLCSTFSVRNPTSFKNPCPTWWWWYDSTAPLLVYFTLKKLLPSLPDRPDGYAHPQRRERPPLQQCSLVPGAPVCPGALPQWRPVQPPAGHLWMRLPEWVLRRTLSEQWVTHLSQFWHFNTEISFLRPVYEKENCSPVGSTHCQDCH